MALNPELGITPVLGRIIRNADRGTAMRLHGAALEKYHKHQLTSEEYLELNDSFFGEWHDAPRGTDPKVIAEKAAAAVEAKRKGEPLEDIAAE